ncbi:MAG: serine/threonine protein kinase [Victivallales bacterium]|nr:serine/threonine protein kinase [Victivallales bacterium]
MDNMTQKIMTEVLQGGPDVTRKITITEQHELDVKWEQKSSPEMTPDALMGEVGTAGEKLQFRSSDTPELRAQLNNVNRRYKFLNLFAEGGFGKIFRAKDRALERTVIIKSLRKEYVDDKASVEKFIAEAKLSAQLDHPTIVPLYSLDTDDDHGLHLAMKYIDGITMKEFLTRLKVKYNLNRITQNMEREFLRTRLEFFLRVCQSIEYSHSREVVHGDLKPENIMLGAYGEVYVMDWGTAAAPGTSRKGSVEGTPGYLAPEMLNTGVVDRSGDVFSLGMILFELATLRRGVDGDNIREITAKIRSGIFEPVRHYIPELNIQAPLKAIIYKAIEVDPEHRYPDVRSLAEDVRRYMFHEEISAKPDNLIMKLLRLMYHHRLKTFALFGLFLLACTGVVAYSLYRENLITREAGGKVLQRINLQFNTDQHGAMIDKCFLQLQNQLNAFAINLSFLLNNQLEHRYTGPIYNAAAFATATGAPANLRYSPVYRSRVSLEYPVYSVADPLPEAEVETAVRKIYPLRHLALELLLQSDPSVQITTQNRPALIRQMLSNGLPARRFFALLTDGIMVSFPGTGDQGGKQDFRNWSWYQEAVAQRHLIWGMPYIDNHGSYILPCAAPLLSPSGQPLGVAGLDVSLEYISRNLMQTATPEIVGLRKYLLDRYGRIVVSSTTGDHHLVMTGASPKLRQLRPFPLFNELNQMIANQNRQQEFIVAGRPTMISYSPVSSLGWYFVQTIDSERLQDLPQNLIPRITPLQPNMFTPPSDINNLIYLTKPNE